MRIRSPIGALHPSLGPTPQVLTKMNSKPCRGAQNRGFQKHQPFVLNYLCRIMDRPYRARVLLAVIPRPLA